MKKLLSFTPIIFSIAFILIPFCKLTAWIFGYQFTPYSYPVTIVVITVLLCAATIALLVWKIPFDKTNKLFTFVFFPLSFLIGEAFLILAAGWSPSVVFAVIAFLCILALLIKYRGSRFIKTVLIFLFVLFTAVLLYYSFVFSIFADIGQNTVVETVYSPDNIYVAEVIDSDQGTLGGDTLVNVRKVGTLHILIGKLSKAPIRVYSGKWREYETMHIWWKDETTLVINGIEYAVD